MQGMEGEESLVTGARMPAVRLDSTPGRRKEPGKTEVCPGSMCRGREARGMMFGGRLVVNSLSPINVKIVFGFRRRD